MVKPAHSEVKKYMPCIVFDEESKISLGFEIGQLQ